MTAPGDFDFSHLKSGIPPAPQAPQTEADPLASQSGQPSWVDPPRAGGWDGGGATSASPAVAVATRPPVVWLWAAIAVCVAGGVLAALTLAGLVGYLAGWILGGPVAIGLLSTFARDDARRQTALTYSAPTWMPVVYRGVYMFAFLVVLVNALRIASWAGHR